MLGNTSSSRPPEDPAVAQVEGILQRATERHPPATPPVEGGRVDAVHALWICACVTMDDAPIWLIYDTADDGVAWRRVPPRAEETDLVDARLSAGGHADPAEVLLWLRGEATDPWAGLGSGDDDADVLAELGRKLRQP